MMPQVDLTKLSREYLKSYYSINSYIGCTINCGYCFLAPLDIIPMRPVQIMQEEQLITDMLNDPLFAAGETVLSLNNRTDPFISPAVKASTFRLMDEMEARKLRNLVTVTTKGLLTGEDAARLASYRYIRPVIIVTYNGIPQNIQPIPAEIQEKTMQNVATQPTVGLLHQFRPIIPGVNDTQEIITKVVSFAKQYCRATIYQGLRINPSIKKRLEERDYNYQGKFDTHKQKSAHTDEIFSLLRAQNPTYPIYEHTSCCLSHMLQMPDYNQHYSKMNCPATCPNYLLCHSPVSLPEIDLQTALQKIGVSSPWHTEGDTLYIDGGLTDEQKSYIKHILHRKVHAAARENTYSEKIMEGQV